jgi:potassium-transporting ATPase KdpC subunit
MTKYIRVSFVMIFLGTILFGVVYPLFVWGVAHLFFPWKAEGSPVCVEGKVVGCMFIGQHFSRDTYFYSRPEVGLSCISGGSSLSWSSKSLIEEVQKRKDVLEKDNPKVLLPCDLFMESASQFDPEISLSGALFQVPRVAKMRHIEQEELEVFVCSFVEPRFLGLFPSRVNVLRLNIELDKKYPLL